jgi:hypothetical protein
MLSQLVVEAQEDFVLPLAQDIMVSAQDLWPSQSDVASVGRYSSALVRDDGQVIDLSGFSNCS